MNQTDRQKLKAIRPNIILISTDHFRRDAVGERTPSLMALVKDGIRFYNAYCNSPLCQPSRNSLITGRYPSEIGILGNQNEPIKKQLREDTFMRHLQEAGYNTAMIGKHHYLDRYGIGMDVAEDEQTVREYGFNEVIQVLDDGENLHNDDDYTKHLKSKGLLEDFRQHVVIPNHSDNHFEHPFSEADTVDGFVRDRAIDFLRSCGKGDPFYLFVSFPGPHPPIWHPGGSRFQPCDMPAPFGAEDSENTQIRRSHYFERCSLIDDYIGSIVEYLKENQLYENTALIFTSDHGDMLGDFGIWDKRFMYESSVGIPLIMKRPSNSPQRRIDGTIESKALVSHLDLYPTILDLAAVSPKNKKCRHGRSLVPILNDKPCSFHDAIIAELATSIMIRTPNWKLVYDPQQGGIQYLFNLVVDSDELTNLAGRAG
ncbi:MAG: sulfatase-like hydrolase/transferase, partial [Spirochaetaceae bacterium]|nr:sulfatase-like hydrolase/transferase [Spirochaetaceae bacterium]